jgi:hypothetical protein
VLGERLELHPVDQSSRPTIGGTFWSGGERCCTDIGTRTIIAIRIDRVADLK